MADVWRESDSDEQLRSWDRFAHARTVMDHEHRNIHEGMAFHATHRVAALGNGNNLWLLVTCPAGCYPHLTGFIFTFEAGDVDIVTFENVVTSADGTVITSFNRNRNSSRVPDMVLTHTPTITDAGSQIHDRLVPPTGSGVGNSVGIISPNLGEEWILKPATKYLVRVTNNSGGTIKLALEALWYELSYEV